MRAWSTLERLTGRAGVALQSLLLAVAAGLFGSLIVLSSTIAVPAVVLTGVLAPYLGVGIGLAVMSAAVVCVALALGSSYPAAIGQAQLAPAVGLGIIASSIIGELPPGAPDGVVFGATMLLIALVALSFGVVLAMFGWRRWGNLVRFVPYPVMGGFLAFAAFTLTRDGLAVMLGQSFGIESSGLPWDAGELVRWLPAVVVAAAALAVQKRRPHPLNLPIAMIATVGAFWLVAWLAGATPAALGAAGYLLPPAGADGAGLMWQPGLLLESLGHANLAVVLQHLPQIAVVWLVSMLSILLVASNLEVVTGTDIDLDQELKATGLANLGAGLCGALPGSHSLNGCVLSHEMGTRSRLVGLTSAALCAAMLVCAGSLVAYLPKMLLGVLLLYLAGLALLAQVLPQWARMASRDRAFLLVVLASLLLFGLLPGIAMGILAGVVLFAISYARLDIIRAEGDGHRFRSNVSRPSGQVRMLARHADTTLVVQLQGYLFFGSAHQSMHRLKRRLGRGHAAARFVILDLARVEGADSSALFAFARLFQGAEERGCAVLLAAVPERLSAALRTIGQSRSWFLDLDHALEHAENAILAALGEAGPASGLADLEGFYGGIDLRRALATYAERVEWRAGDPVVREGERADAMFLVESGRLTTWRETADGRRLRLRTIVPGTVIGEVAFYARSPRSASIVADQASSAFRISRAAVRRMERADAVLASMFHRRMATIAAERAADSVRLLTAGSG